MKTLLVPVDFSDATSLLLQHASDLAKETSGRLVLLHVTEPVATYVPVGASMDVLSATPPPSFETDTAKLQHESLENLASPLRATGLDVQTVAVLGLAVDDIIDQADKVSADYIVLASHGHGALYHLFSGSVVTGVLKRAKTPVLVVPAGKK